MSERKTNSDGEVCPACGRRIAGGERETPLAIARELAPWCLAVIMALTLVWTAVVAHVEVSSGRHDGILPTAIEIVSAAAPASPLFVLYGIMITISMDFAIGGIMATARILTEKFVQPIIEGHRREGREQGREQGREEAFAAVREWNDRRLDAQKKGVPFDEPPPGV